MGAKNVMPVKYFKLKEDKQEGSPNKGKILFYPQIKTDKGWVDGKPVNCMEGYVKDIKITSYTWNERLIENLNFEIIDNDNMDSLIIFQIGLRSFVAQNILNTLAGEVELGIITFQAGDPKNGYPTLYVNNNGKKTKWKYSNSNNNVDLIPKTTSEMVNGNKIIHGQDLVDNFWKGVINDEIIHKMYSPPEVNDSDFINDQDKSYQAHNQEPYMNAELNGNVSNDPNSDLPF